jgi:hypothetical protein
MRAHQDDSTLFKNLLNRKAQLNCICNHTTKQCITIDGLGSCTSGCLFPLEPIGMFIQGEKLTSNTSELLHFWPHRRLARAYYCSRGMILYGRFDKTGWWLLWKTLLTLPRLFQLWAAKHVNRIAGTTSFLLLLHQDGQCNLCLSCTTCIETCQHIAWCPEARQALAFGQSTDGLELWLCANNTHPDMQPLLLEYTQGHGMVTCLKRTISLELPPFMQQDLAQSQDVISWDLLMMGMLSFPTTPPFMTGIQMDLETYNTDIASDTLPMDLQVRPCP